MLATNRHRQTIRCLETSGLQRGINHIFFLFHGSTRLGERKICGMACCDSLSSFPVGSVCLLYYYVDFMVSFGWSVWKLIGFSSKEFYCAMTTIYKLRWIGIFMDILFQGNLCFTVQFNGSSFNLLLHEFSQTVWTAKAPQ